MGKSAARTTRPPVAESGRLWPPLQFTLPTSALTLAGFREWLLSDACPEKGSFGFLDTEIYVDMSPERIGSHNAVKTKLTRALATLTDEANLGRYFSDCLPLSHQAANLSTTPDAMVCTWETLETGRARLVPSVAGDDSVEIEGTPDVVIEVVSPFSERKDLERLPELYHRAGIPEFWLIDARGERVDFRIQRRRANGYAAVPRRGGWQRSAVLGRKFRLDRRRDRLGLWQYTLSVSGG
jgi:Uma2 family endonuclease